MSYCIDTSAFIHAWVRSYSPDAFPSFWAKLEESLKSGRVASSEEVLRELAKRDDALHGWAKERASSFVVPDVGQQTAVAAVLIEFPLLVDSQKGRGTADPFVIAMARTKGLSVVTQEYRSGSTKNPRIPDACQKYGLKCLTVLELIQAEDWKF